MPNYVSLATDGGTRAGSGEGEPSPSDRPLAHYPVVSLEITRLDLEGSPRLAGEDSEHTRVLADIQTPLPPIAVHQPTMRVIDGRHRIQAALLNGKSVIDARLVDCDAKTAFVLAVTENVTHGLPLSVADRKAAAVSIIAAHPEWSDRIVAESTGLSDKTVSVIRSSSTADSSQSNTRLGRDGRLRPLNSAAMRRQAAVLMDDNPGAGLREIARATGLSAATVRDVRKRLDRGEDPVPARYRDAASRDFSAVPRPRRPSGQGAQVDRRTLLAKLMNDPSIRFNEAGRHVLRWLHHYTVDPETCQRMAVSVPDHWHMPIADLARSCAAAWIMLAEQLEQRSCGDDPVMGATNGGMTAEASPLLRN
jgi:ParB-like chromosome segregation protein Spo0J